MCHLKKQKYSFFFILRYDIAQKKKKFSSHFKMTTFEFVLFLLNINFQNKDFY